MSFYSDHLPTLKIFDHRFFSLPFDHDNSSFELCVFYFSQTQAILLKFTHWLGVFFTHVVLSWQHVSFFFVFSFLFCILHIFRSHFSSFDVLFCFALPLNILIFFFSNWILLDAANIIINFFYPATWFVRFVNLIELCARGLSRILTIIIYVLVQSGKKATTTVTTEKKARKVTKPQRKEQQHSTAQLTPTTSNLYVCFDECVSGK